MLEDLSRAYRSVLTLYYENQMNFREIAEVAGISENTVRSRHRRALRALKKKLEAGDATKS